MYLSFAVALGHWQPPLNRFRENKISCIYNVLFTVHIVLSTNGEVESKCLSIGAQYSALNRNILYATRYEDVSLLQPVGHLTNDIFQFFSVIIASKELPFYRTY